MTGVWDSDGATGDPIGDIDRFREYCRRNANAPPLPWFVGTMKNLHVRLRMIALAFPEVCSFVSVVREIRPASMRRELLRMEIQRRKAKR